MSLEFARWRLQAFLNEIQVVGESEFPYDHSEEALKRLEGIIKARAKALDQLAHPQNEEVVRQACSLALSDIFDFLPLLGFILRSTNVRVGFELFGPLLRLAHDLLEPNESDRRKKRTRLLLSSEWKYGPFVYQFRSIPDFVMIGLPAHESDNPLAAPLAGHEFGHAAWTTFDVETEIASILESTISMIITRRWEDFVDIFVDLQDLTPEDLRTSVAAVEIQSQCVRHALLQAEEVFCDCLGTRLFGKSYLNAFAYLISPGAGYDRSPRYPNLADRVRYMTEAATAFQVSVPENYAEMFERENEPEISEDFKLILEAADEAVKLVLGQLRSQAQQIVSNARLPIPSQTNIDSIYRRMKLGVPAENCQSLADILNAAWQAKLDPTFWSDQPELEDKREDALKELVLKNIEVFETEQSLR